jgi:hypothetical protein
LSRCRSVHPSGSGSEDQAGQSCPLRGSGLPANLRGNARQVRGPDPLPDIPNRRRSGETFREWEPLTGKDNSGSPAFAPFAQQRLTTMPFLVPLTTVMMQIVYSRESRCFCQRCSIGDISSVPVPSGAVACSGIVPLP